MTRNENFFQQQRPAAVLKHGVLVRYATVFAAMAGSRTRRVVYLDGYAGPGEYTERDGERVAGSPVLLMNSAKEVSDFGTSVDCLFVEQRQDYAAHLNELLQRQAPPGWSYRVRQGDVATHVPEALQWAGDDPFLVFLDPFGTALDFETLTGKLMRRPRRSSTEILLNFNLEMISRIGGLLTKDQPGAAEAKTLARLDRFLGGTWWHSAFRQARAESSEASAAYAAQVVADEYRKRVHRYTGFQSFPVEIRRQPHHHPLFLLVLFYRHEFAPWKFNEAVSKANWEWREACQQEELNEARERLTRLEESVGQESLWSIDEDLSSTAEIGKAKLERVHELDESEWISVITRNLRNLLDDRSSIALAALTREIYGTTLGSAREMHVNKAWANLANEGLVERKPSGTRWLHKATIHRKP